ncbi:MAG: F0F1 ATP synthase subunit B [Anaerolineales bacterium]|nr:F0F1 ATP synthase subunit B [Anaerolineales bacterium]
MEALGINLGYLLVQIFNFLILFVILRAWVFKPIVGMLEERRERISQGLEDARVAEEAREKAEEEAEKIIAEAQQKANQRVREATTRAEEAARDIRAAAEKEANEIRENAAEEAEHAKEEALGELRGQITSLAMAAAQKLIGEALDEQRQRALIDDFFSGVEAGEVVVLEGEQVSGQSAEVTSAVPLTDEEQERVKQDVLEKLGGAATVSFKVDPSILGGLVVRVGDRVLDGSVAGKLENMRQSVR